MLMNNDKRFDIDLQYGQLAESSIADMLQNKKLEVKTERDLWVKTGNIVIEFESRNKPSGIQTTEADYWFHNLAIGNDIQCTLVFPVDKLRVKSWSKLTLAQMAEALGKSGAELTNLQMEEVCK